MSLPEPTSSSTSTASNTVPFSSTAIPVLSVIAFVLLSVVWVLIVVLCRAYLHMIKYHKEIRLPKEPEAITTLLFRQRQHQRSGVLRCVEVDDEGPTVNCIERVHVIILVHGFIGCPQDLGYIQHACEEQALMLQNELNRGTEPFYVHTCVCNTGRTNDGIQAGGDRVATEVRRFLLRVEEQHQWHVAGGDAYKQLKEITISLIGYSLGGLYARYAPPQILQPLQEGEHDESSASVKAPILIPKVFCTIATPHLGSNGHTYVPIPQPVRLVFGRLSRTVRDLFQQTSLLHRTVSDSTFVEPLLRFERRIAYANAMKNDIMVPTSTAAFITPSSPLEHFVVDDRDCKGNINDNGIDGSNSIHNNPFVVLVVETPAEHGLLREQLERDQQSDWSPLSKRWDHARRLDAMGWSKVFVDFSNQKSKQGGGVAEQEEDKEEEENFVSHRLQKSHNKRPNFSRSRHSFQSCELHAEFQATIPVKLFPSGHDQIAVNSKNALYSYASRRGRPLIDQLVNELIRDILLGPQPSLLSSSSTGSSSLSSAMTSHSDEIDKVHEERRSCNPRQTAEILV